MAQITSKEDKEPINILYCYHSTIFGKVLIGVITQSICHLSFCDTETSAIEILEKEWPQACLKEDRLTTEKIVLYIFDTQRSGRSFFCLLREQIFKLKFDKR